MGRSGPSPHPRTVGSIVTELRLGLEAAGVAAPIVLVGMSFGGLVARTFAHRHQDLVAGMVLVDPSHEDQFVRAPEEIRAFLGPMTEAQLGEIRRLQALAGSGEDVRPMLPVDPSVPEDVVAPYLDAMASEESLATVAAELSSLEDSRREVRETTGAVAGSLGDMPLVVIRHDRRLFPGGMGLSDEAIDSYEATWIELQSELAATSSRGRLEVAEGAGHAIHFERPEVVVSAIREVVEATRAA